MEEKFLIGPYIFWLFTTPLAVWWETGSLTFGLLAFFTYGIVGGIYMSE